MIGKPHLFDGLLAFRAVLRAGRVTVLSLTTMAAVAGLTLGSVRPATGLYAAASAGTLYEYSGGEKVSSLYTQTWVSGWNSCNGSTCTGTVTQVKVSWSISDGSSTFDGIWSYHAGGGTVLCPAYFSKKAVYAGPGSGYDYLYPPTVCTIDYGVLWQWYAGMCDTWGSSCQVVWDASNGPHAFWTWTAPGSSAANFLYKW